MTDAEHACWLCGGNQRLRPIWVREDASVNELPEAAMQGLFCRKCVPHLNLCETCGDPVGTWDWRPENWSHPACHDPAMICHAIYWERVLTARGYPHFATTHHGWIRTDEQLAAITAHYQWYGYPTVPEADEGDAEGGDAEDSDAARGDSNDGDSEEGGEDEDCDEQSTGDSDGSGLCCSEPSCGRPLLPAEAVTWHGDQEVYCLDCVCEYHQE